MMYNFPFYPHFSPRPRPYYPQYGNNKNKVSNNNSSIRHSKEEHSFVQNSKRHPSENHLDSENTNKKNPTEDRISGSDDVIFEIMRYKTSFRWYSSYMFDFLFI